MVRAKELKLNEKEKGALAQFIAFLATRTLSFDAWQKNMSIGMQKQLMVETARNKNHLKASFERSGIITQDPRGQSPQFRLCETNTDKGFRAIF